MGAAIAVKQRLHFLDWKFFLSLIAILIYGAGSILPDSMKWIQLPLLFVAGLFTFKQSFKSGVLGFSTFAICLLCQWPLFRNSWPAPSLLVGATVGLVLWLKKDRLLKNQFQQMNRKNLILSVLLGLLSAFGVLLWYWLDRPTSDEIIFRIPSLPLFVLIPGVIFISALNAFAEELIFRGLAFDALAKDPKHERTANIGQAFAFGLFHFKGFPFGFAGSILAFVFGYLMGLLRLKSKGLLLPWIAHFTADLLIMVILLSL